VKVDLNASQIIVSGADRQAVGEFAARVRSQRKPEPYNGKGIKYVDEVIIRKQGKAFGS
jgi:large subunit ribosomal protein L6